MTTHYVDASAWGKLVHEEAETEALLDHLEDLRREGGQFVSCTLLATEMRRIGQRLGIPAAGISDALGEVSLQLPSRETFELAGRLPGETLRSLDALHVAAAIETGASVFVTYDARQSDAAEAAGLLVVSPA